MEGNRCYVTRGLLDPGPQTYRADSGQQVYSQHDVGSRMLPCDAHSANK